jgi:hypothetical protein
MPIFEPVSDQVGLRFLGKVISGCRDRTAITSVETECENPETKSTGREGAKTWVFGGAPREISAVWRLIGGAMRTRTKDLDGFIEGARRDRCAIVTEAARPCGAPAGPLVHGRL